MHVSRAMQAARRSAVFDLPRRLDRRTEAGPRQLLRRVGPRSRRLPTVRLIRKITGYASSPARGFDGRWPQRQHRWCEFDRRPYAEIDEERCIHVSNSPAGYRSGAAAIDATASSII